MLASIYYNAAPLSGQPISFPSLPIEHLANSYLSYNERRNQTEADFDIGFGLTARAGYRYHTLSTSLSNTQDAEVGYRQASITENTAIAGINFEPGRWMHLAFDYEHNSPDQALMRTDLFRYNQYKFDWRIGSWKGLSANGRVAILQNRNPQSDIDLTSHNRSYTVAVNYEPNERFSLNLDYSKSSIFSDIAILLPQTLQMDRSLFDERGNGVGGSVSIGIYRGTKIDFGYRGILNVGSFPLNYHQPFASVSIPLQYHLAFKTSWQYFGYNEKGSAVQDYRAHLVMFGLAYSY